MSDGKGSNVPLGNAGLQGGDNKDEPVGRAPRALGVDEVVNPLAGATPVTVPPDVSDDAADTSVLETDDSAEDPDVLAPIEWFEGGLCAVLQSPAVYWAAQFVLVAPMTGTMTWIVLVEFGGPAADVMATLLFGAMLLLAWALAPALAALRDVGRPETGALALLARLATEPGGGGGGGPTIAAAAHASLVRWRRGAFGVGLLWCGLGAVTFAPRLLGAPLFSTMFANHTMFVTIWMWWCAAGIIVPLWYTSLRLACVLASAGVDRIAAAVAAQGAGAQSDADWATQVQDRAGALAEDVLPTLSLWGPSLAALAAGLGTHALACANVSVQNTDPKGMVITAVLSFAAFGLVLVPATVSPECERLIGELNTLRPRAGYTIQAQVSQLESFLKGCNREQGIGFKVFGAVINRQQLKVFFAKAWAVLFSAYVFLGPLLNPPLLDLDPSASVFFCKPDWHHADGSCFYLPAQAPAEWKTWPEAEVACQELGGNLASITSEEQMDVVHALQRLAKPGEGFGHWIGLTDAVEEGAWVWSDGEPAAGFTDWIGSEPNNAISDDPHCAASLVGEDCAGMDYRGWWDGPCELESGEPGGEGEVPGMPGCYPNRQPFACSMPATPSKAHGGSMHGCRNGGWMMGTAHADPGLPPTIVRTAQKSAPHSLDCVYASASDNGIIFSRKSYCPHPQAYGVYNESIYNQSAAPKQRLDLTATTAAEVRLSPTRPCPRHRSDMCSPWLGRRVQCVSLVRKNFPDANAAEFSNRGKVWCDAVYNACVPLHCRIIMQYYLYCRTHCSPSGVDSLIL
jgi:hypothetical protein